jgi:hypothetical protein
MSCAPPIYFPNDDQVKKASQIKYLLLGSQPPSRKNRIFWNSEKIMEKGEINRRGNELNLYICIKSVRE